MTLKEKLASRKMTITNFAKAINYSRQDIFRMIKNSEEGLPESPNVDVRWAIWYLFDEEIEDAEFLRRVEEVTQKMLAKKQVAKNNEETQKYYSTKKIKPFNLTGNEYFIINNIVSFSYDKINDDSYTLYINDSKRTVTSEELQNFLTVFSLKINKD